LATDVRRFAQHLPPVLSQKERLAAHFVQHLHAKGRGTATDPDLSHERTR
jgi:hypothetical protein